MASYKVLADNLVVAQKGATIDESALEGANIQALLEGGHIEAVGVKTKSQTQMEGE